MSNEIIPFNPATLGEAMEMAKTFASSALIPDALKGKTADVFVIMLKGRELGLSPLQSLAEIHVIKGRPIASAALKTGLCLRRKDICEYFRLVESTETQATYETKRVGSEPVRLTWTIAQAHKAGLTGKDVWKAHGPSMLRARCSSALATAVYPDLVQGMMTEDEADEVLGRVDGIEQAPEKDITPAPTSRAEVVKGQIKANLQQQAARTSKVEIVDVPTEPKSTLLEPAPKQNPLPAKQEAMKHWNAAVAVCMSFGVTEAKKIGSTIKGVTGKPNKESVDEADVEKVKAALEVIKAAQAKVAAAVNPENLPPPPGDADAPWNQDEPQGDGGVPF